MKPVIIWSLRAQAAFDRAMELQFALVPNKDEIIVRFRQRFAEGVAQMAARKPIKPLTEHVVKYTIQRKPYQKRGHRAPPEEAVEDWLEVRYRFVDDGQTAEVISVTSPKFPI
jgi:hypothetical protein